MHKQLIDLLKQRYAYEAWRDSNTLEENLLIWKFFLSGNELPGWQPHRIQAMESEGWPPSIQSIWKLPEGKTETLLSVDVLECVSRASAHEFLVQVLGEFQSPPVAREEKVAVGDVAFADPRNAGILFARANLVLLLRNAGRDLVPVTEIARQFDRDLIRRPEAEGIKVVPEILRFESRSKEFRVGIVVPLEVEASDPLERPLWYKFFSRSGEVLLEGGRLIYQGASAGPQKITVFAINANRGATSQELQFVLE